MRRSRSLPSLLTLLLALVPVLAGGAPVRATAPVPAIAIGSGRDPVTGALAERRTVFLPGEPYAFCATFLRPVGVESITLWLGEMERPDLGMVIAAVPRAPLPSRRRTRRRPRSSPGSRAPSAG